MICEFYEFKGATKVVSGPGAADNVPYELGNLRVNRALVITDRTLVGLGLPDIVLRALADSPIEVGAVFDEVPPDSSVDVVNAAARVFREKSCDGIVAVGGGSVLDTAKGVSIVVTHGAEDLKDFMGVDALTGYPMTPLVAVPTTAGTGSEATGAAVIRDEARGIKLAFASADLLPDVAGLDPRMTLGLPPRITASTGMDALTHAVEAYSCRQANPVSDCFARAAIDLARENLTVAVERPGDADARLAMANAALLAGIAFSNAQVGIVHATGHACGGIAHVPHGEAMAIMLPHGMTYNLDVAGPRYGELLLHLAGPDVYAATPAADRPGASIAAVRAILADLHERVGLPTTLSEAGVTEEMLPAIAAAAINDGAIAMNPRDAGLDDVLAVLQGAL